MATIPNAPALRHSSSVVEIASIPRKFQSNGFGALHQLFLPLLSLARDAIRLHSASNSPSDPETAYRASSYMAGELVRDLNFTPGRAFTKIPHLYLLDFLNNQLQVETEVFAKEGGATAFFQVKIVGEITGDTFAVFDPARKREIFTFSLAEAGKPEFFELEFPFLAYHARLNSAEMTPNNTDLLVGQAISMELVVSVQQKGTRVCVHKEVGELFLNVRDVKTETDFMCLPAASLNNIAGLIIAIEEHLCGSPLESVVAPVNKS